MYLKSFMKAVALVCALAPVGAGTAVAQAEYPNQPVSLYVGFEAGGATDVIARIVAQTLGEYTGTRFLVVDLPGAATALAAEKVAKAAPDGYSLFLTNSTTFGTNPSFRSDLSYRLDDFEPITLLSRIPLTLDVNPNFPASSVADFVARARSMPNGVTLGSSGRGSLGEVLNGMAKGILDIPMTDVPYRGGGPAITDVRKGVLDAFFNNLSSSLPLYEDGSLKGLAISSRERSPLAPDMPTFYELGYQDYVITNLYSILAPKETPRPVIDRLNSLVRQAVEDPKFKDALIKIGVVPEVTTPEEARNALEEDRILVEAMMKRFNIERLN